MKFNLKFNRITSLKMKEIVPIGLMVLFFIVVLRGTWLCDDAYITYRTVDNLVNGYGPVWNTDERVQGFTNPLWMLLLSLFHLFSGEVFFTAHLLQIVLSLATALILVYKVSLTRFHASAALTALILSKAFVDFSSSGLENALIHLTLVSFYAVYFGRRTSRRLLYLSLLASAGMLTRMDTSLLIIVPLIYELVARFRTLEDKSQIKGDLKHVVLGVLPFAVWVLFALFYYGFPFPNTAYSKLGTEIPLNELLGQGVFYLFNSLNLDPITLAIMALAVSLAAKIRSPECLTAAGSVVLYLFYVIRVGGDFMSGRFLSSVFLLAVIIISRISVEKEKHYTIFLFTAFIVLGGIGQFPSLTNFYAKSRRVKDKNGIVDTSRVGTREAGLLNYSRTRPLPQADWVKRGKKFKKKNRKYPVLGGVGYTGYYAGPKIHIIDIYGLTEPLLARFPTGKPVHGKTWRIGHFRRKVPKGYRETLMSGENVITDENLAKYFDKLRLITSGNLFSWERFVAIVKMNFGFYDDRLEAFVKAHPDLWLFPKS